MPGVDPAVKIPFDERLGRCYELAGRYVTANPGSTLVHGSIQGMGAPRIGHAWAIDADGSVFEPTTGDHWPDAELFTDFHNAKIDQTYDEHAVRVYALRSKHWGPWV